MAGTSSFSLLTLLPLSLSPNRLAGTPVSGASGISVDLFNQLRFIVPEHPSLSGLGLESPLAQPTPSSLGHPTCLRSTCLRPRNQHRPGPILDPGGTRGQATDKVSVLPFSPPRFGSWGSGSGVRKASTSSLVATHSLLR